MRSRWTVLHCSSAPSAEHQATRRLVSRHGGRAKARPLFFCRGGGILDDPVGAIPRVPWAAIFCSTGKTGGPTLTADVPGPPDDHASLGRPLRGQSPRGRGRSRRSPGRPAIGPEALRHLPPVPRPGRRRPAHLARGDPTSHEVPSGFQQPRTGPQHQHHPPAPTPPDPPPTGHDRGRMDEPLALLLRRGTQDTPPSTSP